MTVSLTTHARVRMQQRGISPAALGLLLHIDHRTSAPSGRRIVFVIRTQQTEAGRRGKCIRERDRLKQLYAITDEQGTVVTVGHRYQRLRRI